MGAEMRVFRGVRDLLTQTRGGSVDTRERGVTSVEYALILSLVAVAMIAAFATFIHAGTTSYGNMETAVGPAPTATAWPPLVVPTCGGTTPVYDPGTNTCVALQPPAAPYSLVTVPGSKKIDLSWTAPTWDGGSAITGYEIGLSPDGGTTWVTTQTVTTAVTFAATGLADATTYSIRVAAKNAQGTGAYLTGTAKTWDPPPVVTSIAPTSGPIAGGTSVTITGTGFQSGATATVGGATATRQ